MRYGQRRYNRPRRYLAACTCCGGLNCMDCCSGGDGGQSQCSFGGGGQGCSFGGGGGYGCNIMRQLPPTQDANSTTHLANQTGLPPATPQGTPPTSAFFSNLTNFQTPYPYVAIGGVVLLAALLIPGGRKAGSSAPTVFHYG